MNAEGKQFFEFTCRDIGAGLAAITTGRVHNAVVSIAPFTPDTIEPVVVTITKEDNSLGAGAPLTTHPPQRLAPVS